jgi:hypothetical protein
LRRQASKRAEEFEVLTIGTPEARKREEKKKRNSAIVTSCFVHKLRNKEAGEETKGADYQHLGVSS